MSLYQATKDAIMIAQKAGNIDLTQKLLDVQKMALDMQEKQQQMKGEIDTLQDRIKGLEALKNLQFAESQNYLINPDHPDRPLCPICTKKLNTEVPMYNESHCTNCSNDF